MDPHPPPHRLPSKSSRDTGLVKASIDTCAGPPSPRHSTDSSHADARPMTEAKRRGRGNPESPTGSRIQDGGALGLDSYPHADSLLFSLPEMQIFRDFSTDFSPNLAPTPTYASDSDVPPGPLFSRHRAHAPTLPSFTQFLVSSTTNMLAPSAKPEAC